MSEDSIFNPDAMDFRLPKLRKLEVGQVIEANVVSVGKSSVFLDVGAKAEAVLDLAEIKEEDGEINIKEGDKISAYVVETHPNIKLSYGLAKQYVNMERLEDAADLGLPVEGRVTGVNKGGYDVAINKVRAFCPISQIALHPTDTPEAFVDQTLSFLVVEFKDGGKNIVVSRRRLLEREQQEAAKETEAQLFEGAEFTGEIVKIENFGAFVDIGGIQGMVHISQISNSRIEHPSEVLAIGQHIRVRVIKVEKDPKRPERMRVGLSMKALEADPWDEFARQSQDKKSWQGKVVRLQPFGAFVEILPGVDGLVHISEMAERRINHPKEVLEVGQDVTVRLLRVDQSTRKISLSMLGEASLSKETLVVGEQVTAIINKVKPNGLLIQIKDAGRDARGFIPAEETGEKKGANLRKSFSEGSEIQAMITEIDPQTGRYRLSIDALSEHAEKQAYSHYMGNQNEGNQASGQGLGSFGALLKNALNKK